MFVKYLTHVHASVIWGLHTPKILDRCMSVKYLEGLHPPKYLTDVFPSSIWRVYTPKIFDGCMSVKYLTHVHESVIWGV